MILQTHRRAWNTRFNPISEAGLSVAATPRRSKVLATPASPVAGAAFGPSEKVRRGRRNHPMATGRRRYFHLTASEFGFNLLVKPVFQILYLHGILRGHVIPLAAAMATVNRAVRRAVPHAGLHWTSTNPSVRPAGRTQKTARRIFSTPSLFECANRNHFGS